MVSKFTPKASILPTFRSLFLSSSLFLLTTLLSPISPPLHLVLYKEQVPSQFPKSINTCDIRVTLRTPQAVKEPVIEAKFQYLTH